MSCLYPLKMFQEISPSTGEISSPMFMKDMLLAEFDSWRDGDPLLIKTVLPCGQCSECRKKNAHAWADRLCLEAEAAGEGRSWFITLTYDDDHLPIDFTRKTMDQETGVIGYLPEVKMSDISDFMKRLRSRLYPEKYRFFGVCEYGSLSRRPHIHIILFGVLPDLRKIRPSDHEEALYLPPDTFFSPSVEAAWGMGGTTVQEANAWAMSYVAGYVQKKLKGELLENYEIECHLNDCKMQPPEGARMSRRPGIGVPWILTHPQAAECGSIAISTPDGARAAPVPRVFESRMRESAVSEYKKSRSLAALFRRKLRAKLNPTHSLESLEKIAARVRSKRTCAKNNKL